MINDIAGSGNTYSDHDVEMFVRLDMVALYTDEENTLNKLSLSLDCVAPCCDRSKGAPYQIMSLSTFSIAKITSIKMLAPSDCRAYIRRVSRCSQDVSDIASAQYC